MGSESSHYLFFIVVEHILKLIRLIFSDFGLLISSIDQVLSPASRKVLWLRNRAIGRLRTLFTTNFTDSMDFEDVFIIRYPYGLDESGWGSYVDLVPFFYNWGSIEIDEGRLVPEEIQIILKSLSLISGMGFFLAWILPFDMLHIGIVWTTRM